MKTVQRKQSLFVVMLALLALGSTAAQAAQPNHHRPARIAEGVRSGELTGPEARGLHRGQQALRAERRAYAADGRIGPVERRDLARDAARLDRQIYNQKHDDQQARVPVAVRDPYINARQAGERGRIAQGVRSGELTGSEVRELSAEQRAIRAEERAYKADGVMTRVERQDVRQDLREASRNIYEEKHDDQRR